MTTGYFLGVEAGTRYNVLGEQVRVLAAPEAIDGIFEMFEITGPQGSGPPPHLHQWPEVMFVLDGRIEVLIGDEARTLGAGNFVAVPARTRHGYTVVSDTARFLAVSAGGGSGKFFREVDEKITGPLESFDPVVAIAAAHQVALA
jgi:quercetin dioxygenase-like cupin family protein